MRQPLWLLLSIGLLLILTGCGEEDTSQQTTNSASSTTPNAGGSKVQDVDPEPVPDLTLQTMDGNAIELAAQNGRVLIINFWATWCAPCREEIPELKELHANLNSEGLTVIGVSLDQGGAEAVKPYVDNHEINYPIVLDEEGNAEAEMGPIYGLPTTLVVNPKGQIVKRVLGIFPVDKLKPTLKEMLSQEGSSSSTT